MGSFYFENVHFLPIDINTAWKFFSSPLNLQKITPPELNFTVRTHLKDEEILEGMIIDYRLKPLFGIPVKWKSEIFNIDKPNCFSDRQLKGPYRLWEHQHIFIEKDGGVLMKDQIYYTLPWGIAGKLMHFIVKKRIHTVFEYRRSVLNKLFSGPLSSS